MNLKKIASALGVVALVSTGAVIGIAGPASAHTPNVNADCSGLTVALTNYQDGSQNHHNTVKIVVDGTTAVDTTFGSTYSKTIASPDQYTAHAYHVVVTAWDNSQYNVDTTKNVGACKTDLPKPITPPTYTDWTDSGTAVCGDTTLAQTRTETDTSYTLVNHVWVPSVTTQTNTQTRPLTEQEIAALADSCAPPKPEVKTTYTDWVDGQWLCGASTVDQTRTQETTDYILTNNVWVASAPVDVVQHQSRALTAEELAASIAQGGKCYTPPPPIVCVATGTSDTEAGDLAPVQSAAGLVFDGPTAVGQARDIYYRVSAGNAQGLSGIGYTVTEQEGYGVQIVIEVNPNVDLDATPGVNHYATLSTLALSGTGTFSNLENESIWYTSKIAYGSTGGQGHPLTLAQLAAIMPENTLLSAPSLHLQTASTEDTHNVVTALTSNCGSFNYVPPKPEAIVTHDSTETSDCPDDLIVVHHTTTTTEYVWDNESASYVAGEPVTTKDEDTTREATSEECPITTPTPTPTPTVTPTTSPTPIPVTLAQTPPNDDVLAHTGQDFSFAAGLTALGLLIAGVTLAIAFRRRKGTQH